MPEHAVEVTRTYSPVAGRSVTVGHVPALEVTVGAETRLAFEPSVVEHVQELVRKALLESKGNALEIEYNAGRNQLADRDLSESAFELVLRSIDWSRREACYRDAWLKAASRLQWFEGVIHKRIESRRDEDRLVLSVATGAGKTALFLLYLSGKIDGPQQSADIDEIDRNLAAIRSLSTISELTMGKILLQLRGPHGSSFTIDRKMRNQIVHFRASLRQSGSLPVTETGIIAGIQPERFILRTESKTEDFLYDQGMREDVVDLLGRSAHITYVIGRSSVLEALDLEPA